SQPVVSFPTVCEIKRLPAAFAFQFPTSSIFSTFSILHSYTLHSFSESSSTGSTPSFYSMSEHQSMHLDSNEDTESQPTASLGPTPGPSPQPLLYSETIINITTVMWESV